MRKYLALFLLLCLTISGAVAQKPRAAFQGIPIEGKINDFSRKLIEKGFVLTDESADGNLYEGTFTNVPVTVNVQPGVNNNVSIVGIYLPVKDTWKEAVDEFYTYSRIYTSKYGSPDINNEDLNGMTPSSPNFKDALEEGEVLYRNIYIVDNIFISISITNAVTDLNGNYQNLILYINDDNYLDTDDYSDEI